MCACNVMEIKLDVSMDGWWPFFACVNSSPFTLSSSSYERQAAACSILLTWLSKKCHFIIDFYPLADYSFIFPLQSQLKQQSTTVKWKKIEEEGKSLQRLRDSPISQTLVFRAFFALSLWLGSWLNFTYHPESYRSITDVSERERDEKTR